WATSSKVASLQCATCATRRANVAASPSQDWGQVGKISTLIVVHVLHGGCHGVGRPDAAREATEQAAARGPSATTCGAASSEPREVALYGVAANCTVGGFNPRMVYPGSDLVAATAFTVTCVSQGDVYVSTSTTGVDLDPDGYTVTVDGGASQPMASNGTVTFTGVAAGSHTVALSGIAGNCSVTNANPQTVTVTAGATTG